MSSVVLCTTHEKRKFCPFSGRKAFIRRGDYLQSARFAIHKETQERNKNKNNRDERNTRDQCKERDSIRKECDELNNAMSAEVTDGAEIAEGAEDAESTVEGTAHAVCRPAHGRATDVGRRSTRGNECEGRARARSRRVQRTAGSAARGDTRGGELRTAKQSREEEKTLTVTVRPWLRHSESPPGKTRPV